METDYFAPSLLLPSSQHSQSPISSPNSAPSQTLEDLPSLSLPPSSNPLSFLQKSDTPHLTRKSLEEFLDLPTSSLYKYQLIDGLVVLSQRMISPSHSARQRLFAQKIETLNHGKCIEQKVTAHMEAGIAIRSSSRRNSNSSSSSTSSQTKSYDSCLSADVAVGPFIPIPERERWTKSEQKCTFPLHVDPPKLIIEITSTNRSNDIVSKVTAYSNRGVPQYVIVDRDQQRVLVHKVDVDDSDVGGQRLRRSTREKILTASSTPNCIYKSIVIYRNEDVVQAMFLKELGMTAGYMLQPTEDSSDVINNEQSRAEIAEAKVIKAQGETQKAKDETQKAKDETQKAKDETQKAKDETQKAKDEKRRAVSKLQEEKKKRKLRNETKRSMRKEFSKPNIDINTLKAFFNSSSESGSPSSSKENSPNTALSKRGRV